MSATSPSGDIEATQHKLFKALLKRKKEVCRVSTLHQRRDNLCRHRFTNSQAGEHFGLEWLRARMEKDEATEASTPADEPASKIES